MHGAALQAYTAVQSAVTHRVTTAAVYARILTLSYPVALELPTTLQLTAKEAVYISTHGVLVT